MGATSSVLEAAEYRHASGFLLGEKCQKVYQIISKGSQFMRDLPISVGGTFDHFHAGHQAILSKAYALGTKVWLGITTDKFTKELEKGSFPIESYEKRAQAIQEYLTQQSWFFKTTIIPISDRFGTTLTDVNLAGIVVSPETEVVAHEINQLRQKNFFKPLNITIVPWVLAQDGKPIHSIRIRAGEIDRGGTVFDLREDWGVRQLPADLRSELKKPLGILLTESQPDHPVIMDRFKTQFPKPIGLITVGDAVTQTFVSQTIIPELSIIDFHIERKKVFENIGELGLGRIHSVKKIANPAGSLSAIAASAIKSLLNGKKPAVLEVAGEEDLLTLLAILAAPLGYLVLYGQPKQGIVVVEVTEVMKRRVKQMLELFTI